MIDRFTPQQKAYIEAESDSVSMPDEVWSGGFAEWFEWARDAGSDLDELDRDARNKIKSAIRNGPADFDTFIERFREFTEYIQLVEQFYRDVEDQPAGRITWEQWLRPAVGVEVRRLRRELKDLDTTEDRDPWHPDRNVYTDLLVPLWADLESYNRREQVPSPAADRHLEAVDPADVDELEARVAALIRLFRDIAEGERDNRHLHELLEFVEENQGDSPASLKEGREKQRATYHLSESSQDGGERGHHGLVRKEGWGYVMTDRGELVLRAFRGLDGYHRITEKSPEQRAARASDLVVILETLFENPYA